MDGRQSSTDRIPARADDLTASAASDQRHGQQAGPRRASQAPRTEACLWGIYRSTTIGIGLVTNRIMQDVNDRLCEMVGYSLEELLGKDARMLYLNDDDYDHVGRHAYRPVAECGTVEVRWRRKDGHIINVLLTSTPLDPDDLSEGVLFTVLDITARKAAEEELQSLFDLSLDMVCIADIHTATFVKVNPAFERTLGYTQEELRNRSFLDLIHPDDVAQTRAVIEEKLRNGQMVINFENRYRHKDGSYRWLSWMSHPKPEQGVTYAVARDVTEQKQRDMALQASEQRYRTLFENANDSIFLVRDGKFLDCNSKTLDMYGCTREQILGHGPADFSPARQPDGSASTAAAAARMQATLDGTPQRFEWQHTRADGTPFDAEVSLNVLPLPGGQYLQGIVRDVTERRKAEAAIRDNERFLGDVFNGIQNGISVLDLDLTIVRVNRWMEWRYPEAQPLIGKKCYEVYQHRKDVCPWCPAIRALETGQAHSAVVPYPSADDPTGWIDLSAFPLRDAAERTVGVIEHVKDITERVRAEKQLRRERDRSQAYLDVAGVMFVALDSSGRVSLVNRKGCEILGYDEREILGMDWFANFVPERMRQDVWAIFDKLLRGQTSLAEYAETPVIVRDRSERIVAWHNTVLTDEAGKIVGTLSSGEDITERKRTEQMLRAQQENEKQRIEAELARVRDELVRKTRLAALGQVSGSIAHDLRNPLGAVRNASYLLKRRLPADQAPLLDHIAIIEQEVIKADRIITNLLNITRARSPNKEPVDVGAMARAVWKRCVYPEGVRFRIELPEEPFIVQADQGQLSQVLSNLIGNAADALDEEGDCVLETARESEFDVLIVRDTGPGWSPEVRNRLFEPLVTTKTSGTGLGLAICRQIIESHGGTIEATDGIPHGAAVRIRLPR
ncbi:MAG: PAS domain S-box protein [Sedimentisphaerales bacterium]|nr:PAS domain S-box protein [Sedimentisphaerales bacterium]HNY80008.1 PAS domain S-box protein [Sedimentisphaerales bacterium]HOC64118.1 PAS domain S-box protein [Sedimentisphaerales bacterium]HOH65828.1 PAS domain S-box protein [Sedimentisphaerales bacterium]HQA91404.1 PAS domain S-box protein [Sedimentisphaerales bacterium]